MPRIVTLTPNPTYDFAVEAPFVAANRKLRCVNPQRHPGGGGLNVARAAARLGAETHAIYTAGGLYGEALTRLLAEEGAPHEAIAVAGETRLAFHVTDKATGDEYRFNLPGAALSQSEADRILEAAGRALRPGDFLVGSGSLPPGATADFWARAARLARHSGARFVLDSVSGLEPALAEGVFLLRQNEHEYAALAGGVRDWPEGVAAFAEGLVARGAAERVVISHGGDGSVMATRAGRIFAAVHDVRVKSAVGAGDSFLAGLLVGLGAGWDDAAALRYGAAAAAATRMTPGTELFAREDVERLFTGRASRPDPESERSL
jgi:6-phosphofructokinase 2